MLSDIPFDWVVPAIATLGTTVLLLTAWRRRERSRVRLPPNLSMEQQSVLLDEENLVYGSALNEGKLLTRVDPAIRTLYDFFLKGMAESKNGDCLGTRKDGNSPYEWLSYGDVMRKARDFGSGLCNVGLKPGNETFVGIYGKNSREWFISAIGCVTQSIVIVPLYDTLGSEALSFIINQTQIQLIVCENRQKVMNVLERLNEMPSLKHLVVIDDNGIDQDMKDSIYSRGVKLVTFSQIVTNGDHHPVDMQLPNPEDLYVICYTSGTTGLPKGVMLTHGNLVANIGSFSVVEKKFDVKFVAVGQPVISYLPLAHMFEQMVHWMTMLKGGKVGYFRGKITQLMEDMKELKPYCFPVVPRLLNRLYDQVNAGLEQSGVVARTVFNMAYKAKAAELEQGIIRNDSIWDKLVFGKLQKELGGNVQSMATGSAPISAEVLQLCRIVIGAQIIEGYGQTECTALATHTWPGDPVGGHVGSPAACTHIRLTDVPDLNYLAKNGQGEVCIKGTATTPGYYNDPIKTAELLDDDGWLHTGDIGQWLSNGTLKIVDRKKHIFKLAQGEYVAPEKIENVYVRAPVVAQVFVDGKSLERYLVGIIVPTESVLRHWLNENKPDLNQSKLSFDQLCQLDEAKKFILSELQQLAKDNKLNSIEQVKNVKLISEQFSVENGLLTPTLKAKRPQLRMYFSDDIDALYKEN